MGGYTVTTCLKENIPTDNRGINEDQLVMTIFSQLGGKIYKKLARIHEIFYDIKHDSEFGQYLKHFEFDVMGITPFSDTLDQVISRLESSELLATSNPSYGTYTINTEYMKREFNKLSPKDKEMVIKMSERFSELKAD